MGASYYCYTLLVGGGVSNNVNWILILHTHNTQHTRGAKQRAKATRLQNVYSIFVRKPVLLRIVHRPRVIIKFILNFVCVRVCVNPPPFRSNNCCRRRCGVEKRLISNYRTIWAGTTQQRSTGRKMCVLLREVTGDRRGCGVKSLLKRPDNRTFAAAVYVLLFG